MFAEAFKSRSDGCFRMIAFASQRVSWSATGCLWILIASTDPCEGTTDSDESSPDRIDGIKLSGKDRERWSRYRNARKRDQFLKSRHAISFVLKQEFGDQHQFVWDSLADGCPVLCDSIGNHVRSVSLSHSENVFAIALDSISSRVGVDCEVVDHVPADAVYRVLEGHVPDRMVKLADPVMSRWDAAMLWTRYEAEWKAMQNGNRIANSEADVLSSRNEKNCGSLNGPTFEIPLRSPVWMVVSRCAAAFGKLPNQELIRRLAIVGPDLCICLASDALEDAGRLAGSIETWPLAVHDKTEPYAV